jgi:small nuclear ribonucleoprotein (snRNP)-like protein
MPNLIERGKIVSTKVQLKSILEQEFKIAVRTPRNKNGRLMKFDQFMSAIDRVCEMMEANEEHGTTCATKFSYFIKSICKKLI